MTILTYKILQVSGLHVLFRKCGECLSNLVFVIVNKQGKDCFYCEKCKALAESYKITYRLQLVVLDICHDLIDTVIAYDDVCETFIGCPASEFAEFLKQDPLLIRKLEQEMVGMYCSMDVLMKKNSKKFDKCKSLMLQYSENKKLIDILRNQSIDDEIQYDPSLIAM